MARHLALVLIMAAMCAVLSSAQSTTQPVQPALPNVPNCPPAQASLSPCISYFIGNSSSPSTSCCSQIQTIFQSQGPCLCAALKGAPGQLGSVFGQAQAMLLPSACNLPANACSDVSGTSTVPATTAPPSSGTTVGIAAAPAIASSAPPVPTTASSGVGSKEIPALLDSAAAGSSGSMAAACSVLIPLLVAYVSAMCMHAF